MTTPKLPKVEPVDEIEEIVESEVPLPSTENKPNGIITTKRETPIKRGVPLTETHGMTTEAERFRQD